MSIYASIDRLESSYLLNLYTASFIMPSLNNPSDTRSSKSLTKSPVTLLNKYG